MLMHAATNEAIRPHSNDERRAAWVARYYGGHHKRQARIHLCHTVPGGIPAEHSHTQPAALGGERGTS